MKIGIDARLYGVSQGGLGRYLEELIRHLETTDSHNEYVIFLRQKNWSEYTPTKDNFTKILADIPWYGLAEQTLLPYIFLKEHVDLMHFPHWNVPLAYNRPFVVTIHDLLLLHHPTREASRLGALGYWLKNKAFIRVLSHASQRARRIITPSDYTKNDVNRTLGVPLEKITTTYLAPFSKKHQKPTFDPHWLLYRFNITKPYVLYVGVAYPHKNLSELLKAWKNFIAKHGPSYQLVVAGKHNYFYNRLMRDYPPDNHDVVYTDFVSDEELEVFYSRAALYVMPSLYEGFGLPALEAMQYDIPVISSNATCLPEILQDAAEYFEPRDVNEIQKALVRGLSDEILRKKLIDNGKRLLTRYSWKKVAEKTLEIYKKGVY